MAGKTTKTRRAKSVLAAPTEAQLWNIQKPVATQALDFVLEFLGCRMGPSNTQALDAQAKERLLAIVRALSIVESRHGTVGANQPRRDPLQCGNPKDLWWKEFTGQLGDGSRFIRGPGLANLWADEVGDAAEAFVLFPTSARRALLQNLANGHDNQGFSPTHSYVWGILYLIHKTNTGAGGKSYQCSDISRDRLIDGAVEYNGGGVADYRARIIGALAEFNDPLLIELPSALSAGTRSLAEALHVVGRSGLPAQRLQIAFSDSGALSSITIDFIDAMADGQFKRTAADDLKLGQKVPNSAENSVCGSITKKTLRTDPEFATLVQDLNADIVFKDEEGTGADRIMSTKLQSGLASG